MNPHAASPAPGGQGGRFVRNASVRPRSGFSTRMSSPFSDRPLLLLSNSTSRLLPGSAATRANRIDTYRFCESFIAQKWPVVVPPSGRFSSTSWQDACAHSFGSRTPSMAAEPYAESVNGKTRSDSPRCAIAPTPSVTWTTIENVPACDGEPVMRPSLDSDRPGGSGAEFGARLHAYGVDPYDAASFALYPSPTEPSGSVLVPTISADGVSRIACSALFAIGAHPTICWASLIALASNAVSDPTGTSVIRSTISSGSAAAFWLVSCQMT